MAALVKKVASKAGVSMSTVSRVMNNHPSVSPDKVKIVRQVLDELGGSINITIKGSKSLRSANTVAFVVTNRNAATSYSYVLTETIHRAMEVFADNGFNMILMDVSNGLPLPRVLATSSVAGLILSGDIKDDDILHQISDIPQVWVTSHHSDGKDIALAGNEAVGRVAANYLIDRGHKRVLYISPFPGEPYRSRCDFFEYTCMRNDIKVEKIHGSSKIPGKNEILNIEWFDKTADYFVSNILDYDDIPTGIFIPNDMVTGSIYRGLYKKGLIPGKNFEIISCGNDLATLAALYPIPAMIDIGPRLMAERAVEQLLWRMNNMQQERNMKAFIEPILLRSPDVITEKFQPERQKLN